MRGLIQAEGYHPKEQLLRQAGPHLFRQGRRRCQEKADMQSERQVDRQGAARKAGAPYWPLWPLSPYPGGHVSSIESQQGQTVRHVGGPSRHKQMFSGYCCSASLVIVFLQGQPVGRDARRCCGKEFRGDGETECIFNRRRLWRLLCKDCPSFFPALHAV